MLDKINIYVPENIGNILNNDASMFEVYKKDGCTINKNRFLGMVLTGYYDDYLSEAQDAYDTILSAIETKKLTKKEKEAIANNILNKVVLPTVPSRKGKNPTRLSLKPTKDTEALIDQIMLDLGGDDYISQYFCRMLMSYCDKPFSKREQIVFKNNFEMINEACSSGRSISFKTIWNDEDIHEIIPYKVVTGSEEMFNYLLCSEVNKTSGAQETKSYRLNRITRIKYGRSKNSLDDAVKHYLDRMIKMGPPYIINSEEEACVKLDSDGEKNLKRIYYGRPQYERKEVLDGQTYYFFKCSINQLFLYFRRFEGPTAEVIYPVSLRERIIRFHENSLRTYEVKI